jgi:hypothetical protein
MSYMGDLYKAGIASDGYAVDIPGLQSNLGRGKSIFLDAANGSDNYNGLSPKKARATLGGYGITTGAYALVTTGMNDIIRVLGGASTVSFAAAVTWAKNMSHLWGVPPTGLMNQRPRFGMSANFATMFTVSGYGNSFGNLYFMHGRGSATNVTLMSLTGDRNTFFNVNFAGPQNATEAGTASYTLVSIVGGEENYFKSCVFGTNQTANTTITHVSMGLGAGNTIFEDCIFLNSGGAAGNGRFLKYAAGIGIGMSIFRNCQFLNLGTALTYGIDGTGLTNHQCFFDSRCSFVNCTDVVHADYENYVWFGGVAMPINQVNTASVALFNGLACHPDVT